MARYLMHVRTPMSPSEAFAYMADLNNFAQWDPEVDRVQGKGGGPGTAFDVGVKAFGRSITLRYDTTKIGDRAAVGLVAALAALAALAGERVPEPVR